MKEMQFDVQSMLCMATQGREKADEVERFSSLTIP